MKTVTSVVSLIFIGLLFSCSSLTVSSDYDREYDFSKFKTYRWAKADEINPNDELAKYPLVKKRFQDAVDNELQKKGMTKLESGEPDAVVLIHAGAKERMQVTQTGCGCWSDSHQNIRPRSNFCRA